jgi:hypothetical protein
LAVALYECGVYRAVSFVIRTKDKNCGRFSPHPNKGGFRWPE